MILKERFCFSYPKPEDDCPCTSFYSGSNCVLDMSDDAIKGVFIFTNVFASVAHFIILCWAVYLLIHSSLHKSWKEIFRPNVTKGGVMLVAIAELFKVICHSVDPHHSTGYLGAGSDFFYLSPILLWTMTYCVILLAYIGAVTRTKLSSSGFQGLRMILFIVLAICALVIFPCLIASLLDTWTPIATIFNFGAAICGLTGLILTFYFLRQVFVLMKTTAYGSEAFTKYLKRTTIILIASAAVFSFMLIALTIWVFLPRNPSIIVGGMLMFRVGEAASVTLGLSFLMNRISARSHSSHSGTKENNSTILQKQSSTEITARSNSKVVENTNLNTTETKGSQFSIPTTETSITNQSNTNISEQKDPIINPSSSTSETLQIDLNATTTTIGSKIETENQPENEKQSV